MDAFKAMGKNVGQAELDTAFNHAGQRVLTAHFDYNPASYTPEENAVTHWAIPFYKWYRNNIPYEFANAVQHPGQYTPYLRAMYNAYNTQGVDPQNTPEFLRQDMAIPVRMDKETGRQNYFDPSGFLPQADIANPLSALFGPKKPGQDRTSEILRYAAGLGNPLIVTPGEQVFNRDSFTGQELANKPAEMFGLPMNQRAKNILDLVGPLGWANRLNPGGLFTKIGEQTGAVSPEGVRPGMNEPDALGRGLRGLFGIKEYQPDPSTANRTRKQWKQAAAQAKGRAMRAATESERDYYLKLAEEARQNL
jgi:hypothetical protein